MSELIVVTFDTEEDALAALKALRDVEHAGEIGFEDTAVVTRDADGKVHVKSELSSATETGAAIGVGVGALVTFFFPPVGMAVGGVVGGAIGAMTHSGIEGSFVKEVQDQLEPGKSAIFLQLKGANITGVRAVLARHPGHLLQTTLDSDAEEALRSALHDTAPAG